MKYFDSIRFSTEEENFELVSAMLRRGVEKSSTLITSSEPLHYSRYMHVYYLLNPENLFLQFSRLTANAVKFNRRDPVLSNGKFGNRSSENFPLNLNLLVSIFLFLLVSFSFSILCLDFIFIHSR